MTDPFEYRWLDKYVEEAEFSGDIAEMSLFLYNRVSYPGSSIGRPGVAGSAFTFKKLCKRYGKVPYLGVVYSNDDFSAGVLHFSINN